MKNIFKVLFVLLCFCFSATAQNTENVYKQIIHNIVAQELSSLKVSDNDKNTTELLSKLQPDGAFSDIDYSSRAQTNWAPATHVARLKDICAAYVKEGSQYYGDETVYNHIVNMINYWYDKNPTSTNWYYHEISWPQKMGLSLTLMRAGKKQVPGALEAKMLKRMRDISKGPNQSGSQGTGANKMDIALQWIYRNVLQENADELKFSIDQFYYPIQYNSGQGIQQDYSYLQHGMQLYTAGYGGSVLTAFFKVAFYLQNTQFEQPEKTEIISNFVRFGYLPNIRGTVTMYNIQGRGIARGETSDASNGFHGHIRKLSTLDPKNKDTYDKAIARLKKEKPASYGLTPYHRHYWRADHTIHQMPAYSMDVRMASTRTLRCENGNGENLKGYFLTEGGTQIVRRGNEYLNIFPVWDWSRIPGTTTPALTTIPRPGQWGNSGQSKFTGGVTDGVYGVTAYDMVDNEYGVNTAAKKSWFFFGNEVVCMGAGIHSSNSAHINTTVNQCLLNGDVKVTTDKGEESVQNKGMKAYNNARWITHDSISYFFPAGGNLNISNDAQSGDYYDISHSNSHKQVTKDVFKMWLDHGVKPANGSYIYYVMPGIASAKEGTEKMDDIVTFNSDTLQAVYNRSLNTIGAVFYKKGILKIDGIEINCTHPCVAMFKDVTTDNVKTYVSDPSYELDSTIIYVKFPQIKKYKQLDCKFNKNVHFAGSTHDFVVNDATPDSVYKVVERLEFDKKKLVLKYDNIIDHLNVSAYPLHCATGSISLSSSNEKVAIIDQNGNIRATGSGKAVITATSSEGPTATCQVIVPSNIYVATPSADAEVWIAQKSNFGANKEMVVRFEPRNDRRAYLRFPIALQKKIDTNKYQVNAKIMMYSGYTQPGVPSVNWTIQPVVDNSWSESGILWSNQPKYGPTIASLKGFPSKDVRNKPFDKERVATFDISTLFNANADSIPAEMSFMVFQNKRASGGKGWSTFYTKESEYEFMHPIVVISIEDKQQAEILNKVKEVISFENHVGSYTSEQLAEVKELYNNGEPDDFDALATAFEALTKVSPLRIEGDRVYTFFTREWPTYAVTVNSENKKAYNYLYNAENPANAQWLVCAVEGANYLYNIGTKNFFVMDNDQWYVGPDKSNFGFDTATEDNPYWYCVGPYGKLDNKPNDKHFMHSKSENGIITGWRGSITKSQYKMMDVTSDVANLAEIIKEVKSEMIKGSKNKALEQIETAHGNYKVDSTSHYMGLGKVSDSIAYNEAKKAIDEAYEETQLNDAVAAYKKFLADNTILPEEGKYYAIESAFAFNDQQTKGIYESYTADKRYAMWKSIDSCGVDFLWKMTPDAQGRYVITSANTDKCLTGVKYGSAIYTEDSTAISENFAYTLFPTDKSTVFELRNYFENGDYATITAFNNAGKTATAEDAEGNSLKSWKSNSCPIFWKIREVDEITVTMNELDYAGHHFPFAADFSKAKAAGAKVYYVNQLLPEYAVLEEVKGNIVAANTPVIIAGEKAQEYVVAIAAEAGETFDQNLLKGNNEPAAVAGNVYTLAAGEGATVFHKFDTTNKMGKNSAYLIGGEDQVNETLNLSIGIPDGIEGVAAETAADHTWYTLGGVRVNKPGKGIFVNGNGKVVLFK